jgi:hypothetical protein
MEDNIKSVQEKVSEAIRALDEFSAEFKKIYTNKVKIAEASHINYTNLILASKKELEDLEKKKEAAVNEALKFVEDSKVKMKTEKDNFDRIMKQEQARLDAEYKKFDETKKDYDLMEKETIRLNQEAKEINAKLKESLIKVEEQNDKLAERIKGYDVLLSSVSQQKVQQNNDQKKISDSLSETAKAEKDIAEQQQKLVETSNAQVARDKELSDWDNSLKDREDKLNAKEVKLNSLESNLAIQQDNMDKEKEVITKDRSNLAAKEANLKQLEKELLEKK